MLSSGEEKAWNILSSLDPYDICKRTSVRCDVSKGCYIVRSLCFDFCVMPSKKLIKCNNSSQGEIIIKKYGYFFSHSCLWYLIYAKDIPLSGKLIRPSDLKNGSLFFRGSHTLPLGSLAKKYSKNKKDFLHRGKELCANVKHYGDASIELLPFPRIPVTIILWEEDEEFPSRADLLFDSTSEMHLPIDIIWSIAMLSVLVML